MFDEINMCTYFIYFCGEIYLLARLWLLFYIPRHLVAVLIFPHNFDLCVGLIPSPT